MKNKKIPQPRLRSFDALKLFAIFLVLWGHSIQYLQSGHYADEPVYRYIYSFHMPLFMMLSGYFALPAMKLTLFKFFKKKFLQLLLPCITWGVIIWLGFNVVPYLFKGNSNFSANALWLTMTGYFWLLKSAFLCYAIAYIGFKPKTNRYCWIILTLLVSQLIPSFNINIMYPCFLVGMALKETEIKWQSKAVYLLIICSVAFLILLCFWDKTFWEESDKSIHLSLISEGIAAFMMSVYKQTYRIVIGMAGSFTFITLFYLTFKRINHSRFLDICSAWGQYTLGVYLLQTIILETIMSKYIKLDSLDFTTFNFIATPLISLMVLIICIVIAKLINKSQVLSFLLFGKSYQKAG